MNKTYKDVGLFFFLRKQEGQTHGCTAKALKKLEKEFEFSTKKNWVFLKRLIILIL